MITEEEVQQLNEQLITQFEKDRDWILNKREDKPLFNEGILQQALEISKEILVEYIFKYQLKLPIPKFIPYNDEMQLVWYDRIYCNLTYYLTLDINSITKELSYAGINKKNFEEVNGNTKNIEFIADILHTLIRDCT